MFHFHANDGRILTPPKELEPMLRGAFPAFFNLLGHIRFFYVADEIWDGESSLIFKACGETLAEITLVEGEFCVEIAGEIYRIADEIAVDSVYNALNKAASLGLRRPREQLIVDLSEYPNGVRCDMCQIYKLNNINDFSGCERFHLMDHHCYYGVREGWGETEFSTYTCEGKDGCYTKTLACLEKNGCENCLDCGEYRTCGDCGVGHDPGECNLGITAAEVTCLILPYCDVERLNFLGRGMGR